MTARSRVAVPGRTSRERGSGSLMVLSLVPVLVMAALVPLVLADAVSARHRAAAAADLAALAGAMHAHRGIEAACATAARVAMANDGRLRSCRVDGPVVEVTVSVALSRGADRILSDPVRRARAGPSESAQRPVPQ